jgi:hypothetical protein
MASRLQLKCAYDQATEDGTRFFVEGREVWPKSRRRISSLRKVRPA